MSDISGMKRFQTNIDLFMDEKGLKNDKELAKELGWSPSALSQRLTGSISMQTLEKIANYFNTTVKELLR